jgi:predicted dehydrogenase
MAIPPRILIIGAGSRGHAYARAINDHSSGLIVGVAEPVAYKRQEFVRRYGVSDESLVFNSWTDLIAAGDAVREKVDGVAVCTLDETHAEVSHLYPFLGCRN